MIVGQIVIVKCGRDKDSLMVVIRVESRYLFLVDGRRRKLVKPKRKNIKHVRPTKVVVNLVPNCGRSLQDADIRKALRTYVLKEVSHIV